MNWISVKDKLPENNDYVLVWVRSIGVARYMQDNEGHKWWEDVYTGEDVSPTHWMRIEPPRE